MAGECAAKPSQGWWGTGSSPEVLPDILIGSIIVYISITLEMLYILLRAPHHEPEQACVCAHTSHLSREGNQLPLSWGKNVNKEPKQMHRIKVFFKLMI